MRISRIFNNNVALATNPAGEEVVVIGRGITFGKRKGQMIDPTRIEQTFVPESGTTSERLSWALSEIPAEVLSIATELEQEVKRDPAITVSHSFILPLADHLNFAVVRAKNGVVVDYPLAAEVTQLYPHELEFGRRALELVRRQFGVELPENEAVPLALHLVNSQFTTEDMNRTFQMTEIFGQIFDIIATAYGKGVDEASMGAARFITHLRYLFVRAAKDGERPEALELPAIFETVKESYPKAFACAQKIYLLLEMQLGQELTTDELTYLTIHIERLAKTL